jgi:sarcosine oxidase subunit alpha
MTRLPQAPTQRIKRNSKLEFHYLGRRMTGCEGDSVASALYDNGVRIFSRSLKYHRPRGLYSLDGESANTMMTIDGLPNENAERTLLRAGMQVSAQNVSGHPDTDRYGVLDRLDRLMPAGFYYKVFHRPASLWPFFLKRIRRMAGLGVLDTERPFDDSKRFEIFLNAEVAVVGGGTAGMNAALAAAEQGLRVCLFEQRPWLGGRDDWRVAEYEGRALYQRARDLANTVQDTENIRVFTHAPVNGIWGDNLITGFQIGSADDYFDERYYECRAKTVVVASGCIERPLLFNNNERPGVMQANTAVRLARSYGILPGKRAVFSVGDDLGLEGARDLVELGVEVLVVADARHEGHDKQLVAELQSAGIKFLPGWAASNVIGGKQLKSVVLGHRGGGEFRTFACDLLIANAGQQALIGPLSSAKAKFGFCTETGMFQPTELPERIFAAGSMLGHADPAGIEASGRNAGLEAATACGRNLHATPGDPQTTPLNLPGKLRGCDLVHGPDLGAGNKAFICFDGDGTYKNAVQCADQGFDVPELAKRFGGFGLGPGQYQVPGQNLAMVMSEITGAPLEEALGTTVRPPLVPPTLATYTGPRHAIYKQTPLHGDQAARGGVFRNSGVWRRARYFSEDLDCRAEIRNVRENVGLLDGSTLGKFRIYGPDALKALQRVYISNMEKTPVGRCKYSAMCNDTGNVLDDGVITKIGDDDYYFTTTSSRAGITIEWFRYHTRYDGWDFKLINLTDALGSINVAGPNARAVVQKITSENLSNETFPYMGYREMIVGSGVRARCLRLGFVGELSYELHIPASYCRLVWDLLWEAGQEYGIRPFGMEAQNCLRAEKGHVIVGTESEQRVTLTDIGMGFLWARGDTASKKVGAPALHACVNQEGRMKLVGFKVGDTSVNPLDGDIIVEGENIVGFACTTRFSETLGWQYGMALVNDRYAAEGHEINLYQGLGQSTERYTAMVIPPHFYDPEGKRLRM